MQIRKYAVKNMKEAIKQIKSELGKDAVILTSKTVKTKLGKTYLEVTAAVDYDRDAIKAYAPSQKPAPLPLPVAEGGIEKIITTLDGFGKRLEGLESAANMNLISNKVDNLNLAVSDIAHFLTLASNDVKPIYSGVEQMVFNRLIFSGVQQDEAGNMVQQMIDSIKDGSTFTETQCTDFLADVVMKKVRLADLEAGGRRICALVGPTGMGKTTTLAKLASREIFDNRRSVGFVTLDTFRIGAVEQLRTYANILNSPVEVARSSEELTDKIGRMGNIDTIFIDTVGISPRDQTMMSKLQSFFGTGVSIEPHLVLSASTRLSDLNEMTNRFKSLLIKSIIVSKIDEVNSLGNIYSFVCKERPPLSYFTTGQNVPDDIEEATRERVADMVLGISTAA